MSDQLHELNFRKVTPEEIDHYIYEARRLRSQAIRDMAHGIAEFFRHGLERSRKNITKTASNLEFNDSSSFMATKGGAGD